MGHMSGAIGNNHVFSFATLAMINSNGNHINFNCNGTHRIPTTVRGTVRGTHHGVVGITLGGNALRRPIGNIRANSHMFVRPTSRNANVVTNNTVHTILRITKIRGILTGTCNSAGPVGIIHTAVSNLRGVGSPRVITTGHNGSIRRVLKGWAVTGAVGVARAHDTVNHLPGRGTALLNLNLHHVNRAMRHRSAPTVHNVVGTISFVIGIRRWRVHLGALSPTRNSGGTNGHLNHNVNSNLNGANNHNRGNRGSHSNNNMHHNFRNNRVPLCHHLPGFNFASHGTTVATRIHLSSLTGMRNNIMSLGALGTTGVVNVRVRFTGIVLTNRMAAPMAIHNLHIAGNTHTTVRTTNNGVRRWMTSNWAAKVEFSGYRE